MVRYTNSQTETQDSSLTQIYDQGSTYFGDHHQNQDLKEITWFQAFSAKSGFEVEDSASMARTQLINNSSASSLAIPLMWIY
ncbi:hypothetical protein RchiOBHm_Chr4g0405741 [Rosa chinensis]|uniref:Uncharacterized protein n=1 Tax=Rosa chinensis TaxID=74649 RepID=A0A2P6QU52_ROSCH|nr:hypothetical protein RchiOBHm_Chr4g0405741 [Rosa chinensis]